MGTHVRSGARRASVARLAAAGALVVAAAAGLAGMGATRGEGEAVAVAVSVPTTPATATVPAQAGPTPAAPPAAAQPAAPVAPAARVAAPARALPHLVVPSTTPTRVPAPPRALASVGAGAVPILGPGPERVSGTPCTTTARACVDRRARLAWLIDAGRVVRGPVAIQTGDRDTPTPQGTFVVQWKAEQYTSRQYLMQMPYAVFFADGGVAFHEGRQDTPSGGCVKLTHDDAVAWFGFLQVGNEVQVH